MRKLLVALGLVGAAMTVWTVPAPAQAPQQQAWWWLAGATGIAPPGVPADGLYVANNPSGTQGVSALTFALAGGGSAGRLRLDLAGAPSGTPVIGLCRPAAEWKAVQGGALSDAPACDPGGPTVAGVASADGQSYTFDVGAFAADGVLDIEVIPGKDASGNNPTFSVAFKKPGADALTAAGGSAGTASNDSETPLPEPSPAPSFSAVPSYNAPAPAFEPLPPDAPITGVGSTGSSPSPASGNASPVLPLRHDTGSRHSGWRIAGFVLLGATAVAYHRLSMTSTRPPRSLVTFGQLSGEEQT